MTHLVHGIVLLPLLGALLAFGFGRRNGVAFALTSIFTALGLGAAIDLLWHYLTVMTPQSLSGLGSLPVGALDIPLELSVNKQQTLIAAVVGVVSFCVQLFARWYLYSDPRYRSFTSSVALFTSAMLLVVFSDDVLLTLMGWEVMGWCSYLLIGHESGRPAARRAAMKAFLVTRFADAPFVLSLAVLAVGAKSTRISEILHFWGEGAHGTMRLLVLLGLICGVLGKSAQIPFTDWLPDAMEGPTPASALIHAATMVAAGTYVLARFEPLLAVEHSARLVLVLIAGATSILAGVAAFLQPDIKRLLAWSTISQVGLMLVALGATPPSGTPDAVLLHLIGHAFFKSLLFLLIGWMSVVLGATGVSRMSGGVRKLKGSYLLTAAGLFTMAGLPPSVAFFSKDAMLASANDSRAQGHLEGLVGFVLILVIIAATTAYTARAWYILTYRTELDRRGAVQMVEDSHRVSDVDIVDLLLSAPLVDEHGEELAEDETLDDIDVLPRPGVGVRAGMWLLAAGSLFGGALMLTSFINIDYRHLNIPLMVVSVLLIVATGLAIRVMANNQLFGDAARRIPRRMVLSAERGFGMERLYLNLVAKPVAVLAKTAYWADSALDRLVAASPSGFARADIRLDQMHGRRPASGLPWIAAGACIAAILGVTLW